MRKASAERGIRDVDTAGIVVIPGDGLDEPSFHLGQAGVHRPVFPGNKEFVQGDRLKRPMGGGGGSGGGDPGAGEGTGEGKSEDSYQIALIPELLS